MVTPSRWLAGGQGARRVPRAMLADKRLRSIVDYPELVGGLSGRGDSRAASPTSSGTVTSTGRARSRPFTDGAAIGRQSRATSMTYDILVRDNEAVPILEKVLASKGGADSLDRSRVAAITAVRSSHELSRLTEQRCERAQDPCSSDHRTAARATSSARTITTNAEWIDEWKVLLPAARARGPATEMLPAQILSKPIVAEPGTACTRDVSRRRPLRLEEPRLRAFAALPVGLDSSASLSRFARPPSTLHASVYSLRA